MNKLLPILSTLETTTGSKLGTGGSKIPTSSLDKISTITGGIAPAAEAPPSLANRIDPKEIGGGAGVGSGGIGGPLGGMMSGGMPCEFELTMEFVCYFVFTFIIYFCVFAFIPYDKFIEKIFKFIEKITKKFMNFVNNNKNTNSKIFEVRRPSNLNPKIYPSPQINSKNNKSTTSFIKT
jgi:hypothetical protein